MPRQVVSSMYNVVTLEAEMAEKQVGIREFKAQLSGYLREVKKGHTLVITERGKAVGRVMHVTESPFEKVRALIGAGVVSSNGRKVNVSRVAARLRPGSKTLAEI